MFLVPLSLVLVLGLRQDQPQHSPSTVRSLSLSRSHTASATPLAFKEFFAADQRELKPSAKLLSLNGKRVRIVGFMVQTEAGFKGGFYFCPRPVFSDEAAGGDADIPPESVFVVLRSAKDKEVAHKPRALEATGILELGAKEDAGGRITRIRLILEKRPQASVSPSSRKKKAK